MNDVSLKEISEPGLLKKFCSILFLSVVTFASCKKENDRPQWDTKILAPLLKSSLGINNIIADSLLYANTDNSLKVLYHNKFDFTNLDSLFKIPDTNFTNVLSLPVPITVNPGITFYNLTKDVKLNTGNDVELKEAIVKSGSVKLIARNRLATKIHFVYEIPKATLNGISFKLDTVIGAGSAANPTQLIRYYDLSGYHIDLRGISGAEVNKISYKITASSDSNGTVVNVNANDTLLNITNGFSGLIPFYAKGYLGQQTKDENNLSSRLDLFNSISAGTVSLENIKMYCTIENGIGVDARAIISNFSGTNSNTHTTVNLVSAGLLNHLFNINRAVETGVPSAPVNTQSTTIQLDTGNSNIKSFIENFPDSMNYSVHLETNPFGNMSGSNDFVYSDHLVNATVDIEFPLNFSCNHLTLSDTSDFSLGETATLDHIKSGTLKLNADNGFPFDAIISMTMLDSTGASMGSLLNNANVPAALLDANLKVFQNTFTQFLIPVDENKLKQIRSTKKIIITSVFTTAANPQHIKLYSYYKINFKLIGDLTYSVY